MHFSKERLLHSPSKKVAISVLNLWLIVSLSLGLLSQALRSFTDQTSRRQGLWGVTPHLEHFVDIFQQTLIIQFR